MIKLPKPVAKLKPGLKIFCLETEWDEGIQQLREKSAVKSLLDFMEHDLILDAEYCFRQVATSYDFKYYFEHLLKPQYKDFNMVYLCFHGSPGKIYFANGKTLSLTGIKNRYPGIFKNRFVHFDSCSTLLKTARSMFEFKKETGARIVTGFLNDVPFTESFLFEVWLFSVLCKNPNITPEELRNLATIEMPVYTEKLGFAAY